MAVRGARLRGVYGKPLTRAVGKPLALSSEQLKRAGQIILRAIRKEITIDIAKSAGLRKKGEPARLPQTSAFSKSFGLRIRGNVIEISSTWPTATAHTTPSDKIDPDTNKPFPHAPIEMTWLMRPDVPRARIITDDGKTIIRVTPDSTKGEKPWIHPGFRKYTFLERGIRKGREQVMEELIPELLEGLLSEYDLF